MSTTSLVPIVSSITVDTSVTALAVAQDLVVSFTLVASADNDSIIYIGDSSVDSGSVPIAPGEVLYFDQPSKRKTITDLYDLSRYYATASSSNNNLTIVQNGGQKGGSPTASLSLTVDGASFDVNTERTNDTMSAALATDVIMNDTTALTPKFAKIDATSSGTTTVINAVTGKKLRVLSLNFICGGQVDVEFRSGTSTALTGAYELVANSGLVLPFSPVGHFETSSGQALVIYLADSQPVDGSLVYVEI